MHDITEAGLEICVVFSAMPRGRPPGSNRERSDWDALLQEHRATQPVAQGGAANAGAAGAAPLREQQLARAQTARLARSDQLRSRQPVATLLRGSLLRPWLTLGQSRETSSKAKVCTCRIAQGAR